MVIQIKVCQRLICVVFVYSPHCSNEDHVKLVCGTHILKVNEARLSFTPGRELVMFRGLANMGMRVFCFASKNR